MKAIIYFIANLNADPTFGRWWQTNKTIKNKKKQPKSLIRHCGLICTQLLLSQHLKSGHTVFGIES